LFTLLLVERHWIVLADHIAPAGVDPIMPCARRWKWKVLHGGGSFCAGRRPKGAHTAAVECPLLAQIGHPSTLNQCLLLEAKRTSVAPSPMSAFDPKADIGRPATDRVDLSQDARSVDGTS